MNWWNFKTKHDLTSFLKVTITSRALCTFRIDPVESAICKNMRHVASKGSMLDDIPVLPVVDQSHLSR